MTTTPPPATASTASTSRELGRFVLAGVAGLVVDVAVLYLVLALGGGHYSGRVLSFLCAVFATWQINRHFTFSGAATDSLWRQWWHYLGAMLGGGAVNYGAYSIARLCAGAHAGRRHRFADRHGAQLRQRQMADLQTPLGAGRNRRLVLQLCINRHEIACGFIE